MKTLADQIKDLENTRGARVARMEEVVSKAMEEGRSLEVSEQEEFDDLKAEIKQLDSDITRYRDLESMQRASAAPVQEKRDDVEKSVNRAPTVITQRNEEEKFQGQNFTRMVIAKAIAHLEQKSPVAVAQSRWGRTNPHLVDVIKADVAGHGSGSGEAGN